MHYANVRFIYELRRTLTDMCTVINAGVYIRVMVFGIIVYIRAATSSDTNKTTLNIAFDRNYTLVHAHTTFTRTYTLC